MPDMFSGLWNQAEIVEALAEKKERLIFAVPTADEAQLLYRDGFLATAPIIDAWDDVKAKFLEGCNVVVLGDCAGLEKKLAPLAKTVKWVNLPSVKVWHASMPPEERPKRIKEFIKALLSGQLTTLGEKAAPVAPLGDLLSKVSLCWHNLNVAFLSKQEVHSKAVLLLEAASRVVEATKPT